MICFLDSVLLFPFAPDLCNAKPMNVILTCTMHYQAAGIAKPISDVSPSLAEDALDQLKKRITSLEMEQQDLKFKVCTEYIGIIN